MNANAEKSNSYSANPAENLTIFDAPNACQGIIDKCQSLIRHPDPALAKLGQEIEADAKQMLDAIVASVDQILAVQA
jgi:hypothetical protein